MVLNLLLATPPTDIWHDSLFQFIIYVAITILAGITSVLVSVWIFRKQRNRKEITYQIVSDAPIASINQTVADRVEFRFDGQPIQEARILVLKVWNSGNVAVKREDYEEPITFTFHERTVISSDILETTPSGLIAPKLLKTFLTFQEESVEIPKILLNPQQSISVTTLLRGAKDTISVRGRIIDGIVLELRPNKQAKFNPYIVSVAVTAVALAAVVVAATAIALGILAIISAVAIIVSAVAVVLGLVSLIHSSKGK